MTDTVRWMIFAADGEEEPQDLMCPKIAEDMATEKDGKTGGMVNTDKETMNTAESMADTESMAGMEAMNTAESMVDAENMVGTESIEDTDVISMSLIQMQKERRDSMPD